MLSSGEWAVLRVVDQLLAAGAVGVGAAGAAPSAAGAVAGAVAEGSSGRRLPPGAGSVVPSPSAGAVASIVSTTEPEFARTAAIQVSVTEVVMKQTAKTQVSFDKAVAAHGPLKGVVHAAVHLDDGLIANLDPERFENLELGAYAVAHITRSGTAHVDLVFPAEQRIA